MRSCKVPREYNLVRMVCCTSLVVATIVFYDLRQQDHLLTTTCPLVAVVWMTRTVSNLDPMETCMFPALGSSQILRFGTESEAVLTVSLASASNMTVSVEICYI